MSIDESSDYADVAENFAENFPEEERRRMRQLYAVAGQGAMGVLLNRIARIQSHTDSPSDFMRLMSTEFERSMTELIRIQEQNTDIGAGTA